MNAMLKKGLAQGSTCQLIRLIETINLKPESILTGGTIVYSDRIDGDHKI